MYKERFEEQLNLRLESLKVKNKDIKELEFDFEKKVCLNITIYLKIPGYAPKYTLDFLKGMKTEDIVKKCVDTHINTPAPQS